MQSTRPRQNIPLYSVSLSFAIGVVLALIWPHANFAPACLGFGFLGLLWLTFTWWQRPRLALLTFFCLIIIAGIAHTLIQGQTVNGDDIRNLPETKIDASTQWRGIILQEPTVTLSRSHRKGIVLEHATFLVRLEAWHPATGLPFTHPLDTPWFTASGLMQVSFGGQVDNLHIGDQLEYAASAERFPPPLVPGELDAATLNARQGLFYHATIGPINWKLLRSGAGEAWRAFGISARDWTYDRLRLGLENDPRTADFLAGMLIGYREEIPLDIEDDFRRTGTLHVFAVSGQNVAELSMVGLLLLQTLGYVRWRWAWLLAPIVLTYCLLTGAQASAIRATLMGLALLAAWKLERPVSPLALWSIAFLGMLVWDPLLILDPGAQLSFAVVWSLITFSGPLSRWFHRPFAPDPLVPPRLWTSTQQWENFFWKKSTLLLAASLAATLVSEPIAAVEFHQITPISIVANLIVVPLAGFITVVGTVSVAVSLVSPILAAWLNNANWLFAQCLILIVGFFAHHPGAALNVPDLRATSSHHSLRLTVFPLQDSAGLLIRDSGKVWLINTGRETQARYITARLLQYYGVNQLDGLILTQISDPDNGGVDLILRQFQPKRLALPILPTRSPVQRALPDLLAEQPTSPEYWQAGQSLSLTPKLQIEVLNPSPDSEATKAADRSLVLLIHQGTQNILWAGKITSRTREELLQHHPDLHAPIIVFAGDSSLSPSTQLWLQRLQGQVGLLLPANTYLPPPLDPARDSAARLQLWPLETKGSVEIELTPTQMNLHSFITP